MPRLDAERVALWRQLTIATASVQRELESELQVQHGITLAWFEALTAVREGGGSVRVHELCAALGENPSSLSRRLDRMTLDGLVERGVPDGDDRRAVTVTISGEGRQVWREANVTFRRVLQQHFARHLTDTDLAALHRVMGKVLA